MNARDYSLERIDRLRLPGWPSDLIRNFKPGGPPRDSRDLALADQIVAGVIKNIILLQNQIGHFSGKPIQEIDALLQKILAVALAQLDFLNRVPAPAAVNEAVEQTRRFGRMRAAGFVNAILRNATRQPPLELPPESDAENYAFNALSCPRPLFQKLSALLGPQRAIQFCRHGNTEPPTIIRLFSGVDPSKLAEPDVEIIPHSQPGLMIVRGARRALLHRWSREGLAQPQDATSAAVVPHLDLQPGQTVLDRCAGMGTKTFQMRDVVGTEGKIYAVDPSMQRTETLRQSQRERNIDNIKVFTTESLASVAGEIPATFDRILLDVPCSNSGVLCRRPEARYTHAATCLTNVQRQILDDTVASLAPGGIMVYSTCSVWPDENENQIAAFLSRNPQLQLIEQSATLPSIDTTDPAQYHDGGYYAAIRRIS